MRAAAIILCLASLAALASCEKKDPCDRPFSCPEPGYISCMPPVLPGNRECIGECHEWIVDNCPDVEFAY